MFAASSTRIRVMVLLSLAALLHLPSLAIAEDAAPATATVDQHVTQGALRIVRKDGGIVECPLKHTSVRAEIAGFIGRIRVTQTFHNPTKEKIEAVYVFPLPHEAAVDEMTMVIGDRKIVGTIKRRREARQVYEAALRAGQTAALLEQERPNIFTQSVGNIEPGQEVKIELAYLDVLRYDMGTYEFHFPMVVGPRYIPGTPSGGVPSTPENLQGKTSPPVPDTERVPDASRISPPILKPDFRNGHDVSLQVKLDAGVPIQDLRATTHDASIDRSGDRQATIMLSSADSIPNKDFVLRYGVVGKKPEMALLAHTGSYSRDNQRLGNGYFMLMIQPKEDERLTKSPTREIIFLVDVSGSMSGEPTKKVIEAMQGMLKHCREKDTVQVITFASDAHKLFDKPVPVNDENITKALNLTSGLRGSGGTEMLKGVQMAIDEPIDKERLRIVVMLTDGYIGNEAEIIEHVGRRCGDQIRFWCVGIGASPNMFLVDGVAKQGGGMGKQLNLPDDAQPLAQEIMTRIQRAQLAKLSIAWGELRISETYPAKLPELWAGRPVIVFGRYTGGNSSRSLESRITVKGNVEGEDVSWPLTVRLPAEEKEHDALAKTWARQKIEDLMQQSFYQGSAAVEEEVTAIALDYKLMSQYTSFVAVDTSKPVDEGDSATPPRRMLVPVPLPAGTRWEGFFGEEAESEALGDRLGLGLQDQQRQLVKEAKSLSTRAPLSSLRTLSRSETRAGRPAATKYRLPVSGPMSVDAAQGLQTAAGQGAYGGRVAGGLGGVGFGRAGGFVQQGPQNAAGKSLAGGVRAEEAFYYRGDVARGRRLNVAGLGDWNDTSGALDAAAVAGEHVAVTDGEVAVFASAISQQATKLAEAAKTAWETANSKEQPVTGEALRRLLTKAALLDTAAANVRQSDGGLAAQAIQRLNELHATDVKTWSDQQPRLKTKLDLVVRDQSLEQALAAVAKAAGLEIRVLEGSTVDAKALTSQQPHISYLDLRKATAAEALDWILQPLRLAWQPDGASILAYSNRRLGDNGWIYDVSAIALPLEDDLKKLDDHAKMQAEAQQAAHEILEAVRKTIKVDETSLVWFSPGQLLLFGTPAQHADLAKTIATLQDGTMLQGPLATMADPTRKRYASRKEKLAKAEAARQKFDVAAAHDQYSWQLLSAAVGGKLDLEALTELQIAWRSPQTAELLASESRPLILRSLWTICKASHELAMEKELAALASAARKQSQTAIDAVLTEAATRDSVPNLASGIYAALAVPDDTAYRTKLLTLLSASATDEATKDIRLLGRVLLGQTTDDDRKALSDLLTEGAAGTDLVTLIAFACQKEAGATWGQFRAQSRELLGEQPLPGEVVILVNRLPSRH